MYILYKVYKRMKIMIREWRYVYFCIFRVEEKNIVKLRILVRVLKVETKIIGIIYREGLRMFLVLGYWGVKLLIMYIEIFLNLL